MYENNYETTEQSESMQEQSEMAAEQPAEVVEAKEAGEAKEAAETETPAETDEGKEALGYSSEYYKQEMAKAIKNGNSIAYKNAEKHYAEQKVRETYR